MPPHFFAPRPLLPPRRPGSAPGTGPAERSVRKSAPGTDGRSAACGGYAAGRSSPQEIRPATADRPRLSVSLPYGLLNPESSARRRTARPGRHPGIHARRQSGRTAPHPAQHPRQFRPAEEADLDEYLEHRRELYYVLLANGTIAGCGGINFADGGTTAKISWDIVHPAWQGRSLGTRLLEYRIEKLESLGGIRRITVRTSRQAHRFYEKRGFVLREVRRDYWAEGFDLYAMEYTGRR